jgi:hypothetical protein
MFTGLWRSPGVHHRQQVKSRKVGLFTDRADELHSRYWGPAQRTETGLLDCWPSAGSVQAHGNVAAELAVSKAGGPQLCRFL